MHALLVYNHKYYNRKEVNEMVDAVEVRAGKNGVLLLGVFAALMFLLVALSNFRINPVGLSTTLVGYITLFAVAFVLMQISIFAALKGKRFDGMKIATLVVALVAGSLAVLQVFGVTVAILAPFAGVLSSIAAVAAAVEIFR